MTTWVQVLSEHANQAYLVALRVTGEPALAEDAVQEACVRLLSSPPPAADADHLRGYLLRTVHSAAVDTARSASARSRREEEVQSMKDSTSSDPALGLERLETASAARRALSGLPAELRTAVSLCCELGLSHQEAAGVLGLPKNTVTDRVRRGLEQLRQGLIAGGYAGCAPAALAAGLGSLGVPAAPAGLLAKIQALAAGAKASTAGTGSAAAAAKGGLTVKIVAGVVLAGALAGGVVALMPGKPGVLPAEGTASPPAATAAPAGERVYTASSLTRSDHLGGYAYRYGPASQAYCSFQRLVAGADGKVYGAVNAMTGRGGSEGRTSHDCNIVEYDPKTQYLRVLAGGVRGYNDGPGEVARFRFQFYASGNLEIDRTRGYLYLSDTANGKIRRIRTSDGYTKTVAPDLKSSCLAVDHEGTVYSYSLGGLYRLTPQGPAGDETYKVDKVGEAAPQSTGTFLAVHGKRERVYLADRSGTIQYWDLKARGKLVTIAPGGKALKAQGITTKCDLSDGPLDKATFWCPAGFTSSVPDERYLYYGGGDEFAIRRIDVDKLWVDGTWRLDDGRYAWLQRKARQDLGNWPQGFCEGPDGSFYLGSSLPGLWKLTPVGQK